MSISPIYLMHIQYVEFSVTMLRPLLKRSRFTASTLMLLLVIPFTSAATDNGIASQAAQKITKNSSWSLRLPKEEKVIYNGVASFDTAGDKSGSMVYPAPNAGGFLAAIITHGVIVGSIKNRQKEEMQREANKVLSPYEPILGNYSYRELMQDGLVKTSMGSSKTLVDFSEKSGTGWFVESMPSFLMTQDQSAIILENTISIYAPDAPSDAVYKNTIRVVSQPTNKEDLTGYWTADEGKKLKELSSNLLAQSLDIALEDVANTESKNNNPQKTFRYFEGNNQKIERGELMSETCERTVIKTLRGWLMSIPKQKEAAAVDTCKQSVAKQASST